MTNQHKTLEELFTDAADAIREKTGENGGIVADELPKRIRGIPAGGSGDMEKAVYDPQGKEQDVFAYTDEAKAEALAAAQAAETAGREAADAAKTEALAADTGRSVAGKTVEPGQGVTVTAGEGAEIFNDYRARAYDESGQPVQGNVASGSQAHAEGIATTASGLAAHAEGAHGTAEGNCSHVEGGYIIGKGPSKASGYAAHAEGASTLASGAESHAEGASTLASGAQSHAEGSLTQATKVDAHAEGYATQATGINAHAEGENTQATGNNSHAEGYMGIAEGSASHVEGGKATDKDPNKATGDAAHAEGASTLASGTGSHAEGQGTQAVGGNSHAEGYMGIAEGYASHVEGGRVTDKDPNKATGYAAHAEGASTLASGAESHAEGASTLASGAKSHAEGLETTASGTAAHAEGIQTTASGHQSHAGGHTSQAKGFQAFAHGLGVIANEKQFVFGRYNVERTSWPELVVGNGTGETARANCFRAAYNGVFASGSYNASGADYAELFEWADGNHGGGDRVGRFVTLEGSKIRLAGPGEDYILGIVSGAPSVVGDVYDDQWQGMYLTDVFGRPLWEDVEIPEEFEEVPDPEAPEKMIRRVIVPAHTERRQKLNPDYDSTQKYVPRTERSEWAAVGLLGKLVVLEDGSCKADGWCTAGEGGIATASEARTRFRCMEKLTDPDTGRKCVRVMILNA